MQKALRFVVECHLKSPYALQLNPFFKCPTAIIYILFLKTECSSLCSREIRFCCLAN
uniref:Uncharacterized protein n=1 Tax=Anguilla anguilla TaxID=7936 RepID=A0A0E9WHB3_ANGAN